MPSSFSVSTATPVVTLDRGTGTAAFTVSNVAATPVRGRLVVVPVTPTRAAWLVLDGDAEREFATNEAQQVGVRIAVPADANADVYPFRLNVLSVVNPDGDFAEGPVATFEVKHAAPPPPLPWKLILGIAAAVVAAAVIALVVWLTQPKPVPDVVTGGMSFDAARAKLEAAGLKVVKEEEVTEAEPGTVLRQEPPAGAKRPPDGTVTLTVEASLVDVPVLVGKSVADAEAALKERYLFYVPASHELNPDPAKANTIKAQKPLPPGDNAMFVRRGSSVLVDVYEAGVKVPPLVGKKWADPATAKLLTDAGLVPGTPTNGGTAGPGPGTVLAQNPPAGDTVATGRTVDVTVQERQINVPNLVGKLYGAVEATLRASDLALDPNVTFQPPLAGLWRPTTVLSQVPAAGAVAKSGDKVRVTVATAPILIHIDPNMKFEKMKDLKPVDPAVIEAMRKIK